MKPYKYLALLALAFTLSSANYAQKPEKATSPKTQCKATTQKGTRCKLKVADGSKYCPVHSSNNASTAQCKAKTKEGKRCSRAATKRGYCAQHFNMKDKK